MISGNYTYALGKKVSKGKFFLKKKEHFDNWLIEIVNGLIIYLMRMFNIK